METTNNPCGFVSNVFKLDKLPDNIRLSQWYDGMRIPRMIRKYHRNICDLIYGSSLVNSEGAFIYRAGEKAVEIKFNGYNAQYHALYESGYKYGYEFETAVLLTRLLTGSTAFYDVGANWGYFSLLSAASPSFTGPIFAFEPNPKTYQDLTRTVRQACLSHRITNLNYGLGQHEGELYIEEPEKFKTGLSRLTSSGSGQKIPIHTLDTINLAPPGIIKIDAEGMEIEVFMGGEQIMRQHKPFIVFENFLCYHSPEKTWLPIALLQRWGYKVFNPALAFNYSGKYVFVNYGDSVDELLKHDPNPKTALIEISEENRFLMRHQLNVFACHQTRLNNLADSDFVHFQMSNGLLNQS